MKTSAAKFLAAIIASILSSSNAFAAPANAEQRADTCLTSPRDYAPPGARWRYRVERGTGRHCWFLKDEAEKTAGKAAKQSTAAAEEEPAPEPPRKKAATARSVSDARAEFAQTPFEQDKPAGPPAPAASTPIVDGNQASIARTAKMLAPAAATRWPDPVSTANSAANPPAAPSDPNAEARIAPAATPPSKLQVMPRAVPPMPASEKPMSLPMLITIVAGGLSVLAVLVSMLFAWLASRKSQLTPSAPMPPLEMSDQPRRPGDLYRERQRMRSKTSRRHAA